MSLLLLNKKNNFRVWGIFPATAGNAASKTITIYGARFSGSPRLTINGVTLTGVTVVSSAVITATVPAGISAGTYGLKINGSTKLASAFKVTATLAYDTFTGTNGTNLTAHTPDTGPTPYAAYNSTWTLNGSNQAVSGTPSGGYGAQVLPVTQSDVSVTTKNISAGSGGPAIRPTDNNNYWFLYQGGSNVYKRVAGSNTQKFALVLTTSALTNSEFTLTGKGPLIFAKLNSSIIGSGVDTFNQSTQGGGLGALSASSTFDNLDIEPVDFTVPFADSFTRADGAIGTGEAGGAWTVAAGSAAIATNAASLGASSLVYQDGGSADGTVEVKLGGTLQAVGNSFRASDASNQFKWGVDASAYYSLLKVEAGVSTALTGTLVGTSVANDYVRTITNGPRIVLKRNNLTFSSFRSTFNQTATKHGLSSTNAGSLKQAWFSTDVSEAPYFPAAPGCIIIGNSFSAGIGPTNGKDGFVTVAIAQRPDFEDYLNLGVPGKSTATMLANASFYAQFYDPARSKNIAVIQEITNDINTVSAAQAYANVVALYQALKAQGWTVFTFTCLPQGTDAALETKRIAVNLSMTSSPGSCSDRLMDIGSDATIGLPGSQNNTTYYNGDKLHLVAAGHTILANSYLIPALQAEIGY